MPFSEGRLWFAGRLGRGGSPRQQLLSWVSPTSILEAGLGCRCLPLPSRLMSRTKLKIGTWRAAWDSAPHPGKKAQGQSSLCSAQTPRALLTEGKGETEATSPLSLTHSTSGHLQVTLRAHR